MPVAFVISQPEEDIVNAISKGKPKPHMDGSLLKFRGEDVREFIDDVVEYTSQFDTKSEEFRAGVRLTERLGGWVGERTVGARDSTREDDPVEDPVDTPELDAVPIKTRRKRAERSDV